MLVVLVSKDIKPSYFQTTLPQKFTDTSTKAHACIVFAQDAIHNATKILGDGIEQ